MVGTIAAFAIALTCVACFTAVMVVTRALDPVKTIFETVAAGTTAMLDPVLDDDQKERAVRRSGLALIAQSFQVAWRFALAIGSAWGAIVIGDRMGLVPEAQSFRTLLRADFIIVVTAAAILLHWGLRRVAPKDVRTERITDSSAYSAGDQIVHAFAFSSPTLQRGLAGVDDRIFLRKLKKVPDSPPIFITSLARGGTTALLNAMSDHPDIATHQYSDMPFLTAPMLWSRLAGRREHATEHERAHGDGLKISLRSPEAFDEILWMLQWPEKYHEACIDLWSEDDFCPEASGLFRNHFRKIISLRHPETIEGKQADIRYLSKNNANIARLNLLPKLFPGCRVVIALREPSAHAASLHRQHLNFLELHSRDGFSARYMRDIGHFEFGDLHRPIAFDPDFLARCDPMQPDYWLAYWIAAFEDVRHHADELLIVDQADLRREPTRTMEALQLRLGLQTKPGQQFDEYFVRKPDAARDELFDADLLRQARSIYDHLGKHSLNGNNL